MTKPSVATKFSPLKTHRFLLINKTNTLASLTERIFQHKYNKN